MPDVAAATDEASVHQAVLTGDIDDFAWPGAVITRALCGHWEHDGPCWWPHHNEASAGPDGVTVRTVFVPLGDEQTEVLGRMAAALVAEPSWTVSSAGSTDPRPDERAMWARLSGGR